MKRFLILTKAIFLMHLRNGFVLFWNFAFPVLLMLIYGVVMSQYMDYMTPGVIVLNALSFGLVGSSNMMLEMREKSVLRRLQASPLPAGQLIGSYLLVNLLIGILQSTLIIIAGVLLYKVPGWPAGVHGPGRHYQWSRGKSRHGDSGWDDHLFFAHVYQ